MASEKFQKFIDMWVEEFGIEKSIDEKLCQDKDGNPLPWYTYPAIEYLSQLDYTDKKIFEFGCGYSSIFWAKRAKSVVSIEDNLAYFDRWSKEFTVDNLNIKWRDEGEAYENAIFEDNLNYDVIIVDGKRRAECAAAALVALSDDGMIILDDSDRVNTSNEYVEAISKLKNADLIQIDFYGFCPMNNYTKTTSIFLRRSFDFKSKNAVQPINGWGNLWSKGRKQRKEFYKQNN